MVQIGMEHGFKNYHVGARIKCPAFATCAGTASVYLGVIS